MYFTQIQIRWGKWRRAVAKILQTKSGLGCCGQPTFLLAAPHQGGQKGITYTQIHEYTNTQIQIHKDTNTKSVLRCRGQATFLLTAPIKEGKKELFLEILSYRTWQTFGIFVLNTDKFLFNVFYLESPKDVCPFSFSQKSSKLT